MRTVDYSDVLRGSLALAGILDTDIDAGGPECRQLRSFHDRRLRLAWEIHSWPDLCRYEQRAFRPPWNVGTTYATGAEVLDLPTLTYFQALQASTGQAPTIAGAPNDAYWAECQTQYTGSDYSATGNYVLGNIVRNPADGLFYQLIRQNITVTGADDASNGFYTWDGSQYVNAVVNGYKVLLKQERDEIDAPFQYWWAIDDNLGNELYAQNAPQYAPIPAVTDPWQNAPGVAVTFSGGVYSAPPSSSWALLTPFQRYVAYEQTDINGAPLTPIGEVLFAYDRDPRVTTKLARLPFLVTSDGFAFTTLRHTPAYVWLHYRQRRPTLTGDLFDPTLVYSSGRQMYYADPTTAIGNFYNCTAATAAGESPATTPAKWSRVELPYIFREYLVQGGYADWLTSDGQGDKAAAVEGLADTLLELEADKLQRQQGQVNRLNFRS